MFSRDLQASQGESPLKSQTSPHPLDADRPYFCSAHEGCPTCFPVRQPPRFQHHLAATSAFNVVEHGREQTVGLILDKSDRHAVQFQGSKSGRMFTRWNVAQKMIKKCNSAKPFTKPFIVFNESRICLQESLEWPN